MQHLQVQQVLDNVVRMEGNENQDGNQPDGTMSDNLQIVKDEKGIQNCAKLLSTAQFGLQDIKSNFTMPDIKSGHHMMDVRTADGSIVKISAGIQDQDLAKTLGVEMVQNMYKVNVDDINQLLAYHEVFGKLQNEIAVQGTQGNSVAPNSSAGNLNLQNSNVINKNLESDQEPSTSSISADSPPAVITAGTHVCDLCGKMFPFRYQLIVHRRYHTERKPFTCQVNIFFIYCFIFICC